MVAVTVPPGIDVVCVGPGTDVVAVAVMVAPETETVVAVTV